MSDSNFDPMEGMEEQKVEYKNVKFGKVGDWFKGTLTENTRQMKNNLSAKGEMQTIYVFKAHGGSFHNIVERNIDPEATVVNKDEFWSFITGKPALVDQLKKASLGQIVGLRFAEVKKSKTPGFNDTKIIKVLLGGTDDTYQGESQGD